ncbi:hypothetical protein [Frankia sp. Cr1]|uniref:hypothetical protein n=1 Tax=Frankia sp. Cr1 TaxID=3073931 RepID=UPI002AD3C3A9|nr:hypothetical protein [Frankia sp. Cr1]
MINDPIVVEALTSTPEECRADLQHLYVTWLTINDLFFGDALTIPTIELADLPFRLYGDYDRIGDHSSHIRINRRLVVGTHPDVIPGRRHAAGRLRLAEDILLHETVHAWQDRIIGVREPSWHGHGPIFRDRSNAIGEVLGLAPVRSNRDRGRYASRPICSGWPMVARPPGFYAAAPQTARFRSV